MDKKLYIITGECNGNSEDMGCVWLTDEQAKNRYINSYLSAIGNELLRDTFTTGFSIEPVDYSKMPSHAQTDNEIENYIGLASINYSKMSINK